MFGQSETVPKIKEELAAPLRTMQAAARHIGKTVADARIPIDVDQYVASFKTELMDAVYRWFVVPSQTLLFLPPLDPFS
jgi:ATP-dependent RNA helicase DOB1